jgi:hypothetical protein
MIRGLLCKCEYHEWVLFIVNDQWSISTQNGMTSGKDRNSMNNTWRLVGMVSTENPFLQRQYG